MNDEKGETLANTFYLGPLQLCRFQILYVVTAGHIKSGTRV